MNTRRKHNRGKGREIGEKEKEEKERRREI